MPIQRLPRYSLILRHLLQIKEDVHVSESLKINQKMTNDINDSMTGGEHYGDISNNLNLDDPLDQKISFYKDRVSKRRTGVWTNLQLVEMFAKKNPPKKNEELPSKSPRKRKSLSIREFKFGDRKSVIMLPITKSDTEKRKSSSSENLPVLTELKDSEPKKRKSTEELMDWMDFIENE